MWPPRHSHREIFRRDRFETCLYRSLSIALWCLGLHACFDIYRPGEGCPSPAEFHFYGQASRPISTGKLNTLLRLHTQPINVVVYNGPSGDCSQGYLILKEASRLDAFSGYPFHTWLPSDCAWRHNWNTRGMSIPVLSY